MSQALGPLQGEGERDGSISQGNMTKEDYVGQNLKRGVSQCTTVYAKKAERSQGLAKYG